jgi:hypothetical protein
MNNGYLRFESLASGLRRHQEAISFQLSTISIKNRAAIFPSEFKMFAVNLRARGAHEMKRKTRCFEPHQIVFVRHRSQLERF